MVPEKAWMVPNWIWYQLAMRDPTVPAMASQPRGLRLEPGFRHGSANMTMTPTRVRISSGRRARTLDDIYFVASWASGICDWLSVGLKEAAGSKGWGSCAR